MIDSLLGLVAALTLVSPVQAATVMKTLPTALPATEIAAPAKRRMDSLGVQTTSHSMFVADVATGSVLYAKRPHDVMPIASLTKLMTAMVYLDTKPNLDETVTFTDEDVKGEAGGVFTSGETITKHEALEAMLIGSVNAAGNALARTSLGREAFVKAMNDKAKSLDLATPSFVDPTGLDPKNQADAADVAAMLSIAISYPDIRSITEQSHIVMKGKSGKDYDIKSTNLLFDSFLNKKPFQIVGGKTGSLPEAGFCLAQVTRDAAGHEIVVASLASTNHFARFQDVKAITAWAFDSYAWQ